MSQKYTAEEVRAVARRLHDDITVKDGDALAASDMLTAYADSIERAQAGVTDEAVELALNVFYRHGVSWLDIQAVLAGCEPKHDMRAALEAVAPLLRAPAEQGGRVPEPTEAMVEAICRAHARESVWPNDFDQIAQRLRREAAVRGYKAALAAAPSKPTGQDGGEVGHG